MASIKRNECKCTTCTNSIIITGNISRKALCNLFLTKAPIEINMVEVDSEPDKFLPDVTECTRYNEKVKEA